jgi:isopenicillin-N epimerase
VNSAEWLLDPDVAYLNHGAFGALPRVVAAQAHELRLMMERNPADLMMRRLQDMLDDVRGKVCELLTADDAGCVFMPNATAGTATVIASLSTSFASGDEILITDHRYGAVAIQTDRTSTERSTATVVAHVPLDVETAEDVVTAIVERFTPRTKLLVIDGIASLSGFVFPVAQIVAAAHERGVPVLVDAAHSPGQVANNLREVNADFWVGNLHKWVCSPRGAAILSIAPQWRDAIKPFVASHHFGQGLHESFDWTGTFDPTNILAIPTALDFWERKGWDAVRQQQQGLVDVGAATVAQALGTTAPVRDAFRAAMRIIELPETLSPERATEVENLLSDKHLVEVSIMHLQGKSFVRVCGQIYNTAEDYDRLATALPDLVS